MGGFVARIGLIGAVLFGGWLFRDYITGAATDLQVGDCFDVPTTADQTVDEVAHHPCTDAHTGEVVFVADYPASGAYPGEDAFDAFTYEHCIPAFNEYTGLDYETATDYGMGVMYPIEQGWASGDHEITCYVGRTDGTSLSQSLKRQ